MNLQKHLLTILLMTQTLTLHAQKPVITIYSSRHYRIDQTIYKNFEKSHNVTINLIKGSAKSLIEKLAISQAKSKADLLILSDAGMLQKAKERQILQSINLTTLNKIIPHHLRDQDGQWYAITKRSRVIIYNPQKVQASELKDYISLRQKKWQKRILIRSSTNNYNRTLLASLLARHGKAACTWAKALVKNMARAPKGGDRDQIKALVRGEGDIALINSYYVGLLRNSLDPKEREIGNAVRIFSPIKGGGTHINISGAALTRWSPNKKHALDLLEYLLSPEAQRLYMLHNYEYPVNKTVPIIGEVKSWGPLKEDALDFNIITQYTDRAAECFQEAGWS